MKTRGSSKTRYSPARSTAQKVVGTAKKSALEKARSALKKGEHAHTPLSIRRKLKPKREKTK